MENVTVTLHKDIKRYFSSKPDTTQISEMLVSVCEILKIKFTPKRESERLVK